MRLVAITVKQIAVIGTLITALIASTVAQAEYRLNFQDPVTEVARDIFGLHMLIFWICVVIFVVVFGFMFYSIFAHRKSKNYEASTFSHSTKVEIAWTVIPFIILVVMAIPATQVLIKMEDTTKSDLTIKITGFQWKWGYEYLDSDVSFYSTLSTPREQIDQFDASKAVPLGENYLLEVDKHLVVPSGRKVRALITANDVIHAWWIPAFGSKKDAIPGYINELWFNVDEGKEGLYRGQCAELCGKDHAFMPIVVEVVTGDQFDRWLAAGGKFDAQDIAAVSATNVDSEINISESAGELLGDVAESAAQAVPAALAQDAVSSEVSSDDTEQTDLSQDEEAISSEDDQDTGNATYTKDELMTKGEEVATRCIACHGAGGNGIPGVFPAITGSAVATGPIDEHIDIVMFGIEGTAMAAFAGQLNDEQLASVITFQRNSFGNNTGDVVLPSDIKAKRQ